MRRIFAFVGLWSALCCPALAQSKDQPSGGAEQAVMRIERDVERRAEGRRIRK